MTIHARRKHSLLIFDVDAYKLGCGYHFAKLAFYGENIYIEHELRRVYELIGRQICMPFFTRPCKRVLDSRPYAER